MLVSLGRQAWHDQRVSSSHESCWRRVVRALVAAAAVLTVVSGCTLRFGTPVPEVPTPGAAENARAEFAAATENLMRQARAAADGTDGALAEDLKDVADASEAHLKALGGIWTPPARPGTPSPTPSASPAVSASPHEVLATLTELAQADDVLSAEIWTPDAATLIASITIYRHSAMLRLRHELDEGGNDSPELPALPENLTGEAEPLCRTLDALGYAYEVRAARSEQQRQDQLAARAQHYRAMAQSVAAAAGVDGTEQDPRSATYDVGADLKATIGAWQEQLVPAWLSLIGPAAPAVRPGLVARAQQALAHTSPEEDDPFPGLQQSS